MSGEISFAQSFIDSSKCAIASFPDLRLGGFLLQVLNPISKRNNHDPDSIACTAQDFQKVSLLVLPSGSAYFHLGLKTARRIFFE